MPEDLLDYYRSELHYVRRLAADFAQAHPDVAAELRLGAKGAEDPYVERLIEAFAYLNARTRKKLDDDFPEVAAALLSILHPHYLSPIPSMAVAQFELDPSQGALVEGFSVPRGTALESEEVDGEPCEFRTAFDLVLRPLRVGEAGVVPAARLENVHRCPGATIVIRMKLATFAAATPIQEAAPDALDFYVDGQAVDANELYALLFTQVLDVGVTWGATPRAPVWLGRGAIEAFGFDPDQAVLPADPRTLHAYRLLTEYFALPERFRFVRLRGFGGALREAAGNSAELHFHLRDMRPELHGRVQASTFRLGCTPIVNLFRRTADPFALSEKNWRHHVIPDARRTDALEVYSIESVSATRPDQRTIAIPPLFSAGHALREPRGELFWFASRREAGYREGRVDPATEVDLMFCDLESNRVAPEGWTIEATTTCLNRDLPARLTFGPDRPRIRSLGGGPLAPVRCLTPPTPTLRPSQRAGQLWRVISHLALNQLSLVEGAAGAAALRELLALYDFSPAPDRRARIRSIRSVRGQRHTTYVTRGDAGLCRGVRATIELDEADNSDNGAFLFAAVLERFLGLYCSVNSFSQLVMRSTKHAEPVYEWLPRCGERQLL